MTYTINCPECNAEINVEEALAKKFQANYEQKLMESKRESLNDFKKREKELEEKYKNQDKLIATEVQKVLSQKEEELALKFAEENGKLISSLKEDLEKKNAAYLELQSQSIDLQRKERELKERTEGLEIELKRKLFENEEQMRNQIQKEYAEKFEVQRVELQKKEQDLQKAAEEMKRKAGQGSMQLQGESQELALEELLKATHLFDKIDEVKKGAKGADCIQTVINNRQQECGKIIYESKRTKNFTDSWIDKLKDDQLSEKAEISVIVTQTMPKDMDTFGMKKGVWICRFSEVKALSVVLRKMLVKMHAIKLSQTNQGTKMGLLYDYLVSPEFVQTIERICTTYNDMTEQLNSEKRAFSKQWATREMHIEKLQTNTISMFGSIQGITGNELPTPEILSLPE